MGSRKRYPVFTIDAVLGGRSRVVCVHVIFERTFDVSDLSVKISMFVLKYDDNQDFGFATRAKSPLVSASAHRQVCHSKFLLLLM